MAPRNVTLDEFRAITEQRRWAAYATLLLNARKPDSEVVKQFDTHWIEAGHRMREQIADDRTLVRLLRHLLPHYEGTAIDLFRGENRDRWQRGLLGLAWTTNVETAKMFGRGLNAVGSGGVLLNAHVEPDAIISGPNAHSTNLGESQFTVDPFALTTIVELESFPSSY